MATDWAEVYRSTYRELVRFLDRKVWDPDRAQELAQEAFVRGLRQEGELDDPRAWLFQVARNLARDEARTVLRRRKHLTLLKAEEGEEPAVDPEGPARVVEEERRDRVRRALEELTERDREVLLLWDAGLSYREIAREISLSPGAIGTTLARARKRLVDAYDSLEERDAARG